MFETKDLLIKALGNQKTVCSPEQAEEIANQSLVKEFSKGDAIALQGVVGEELYYIIGGSVDVVVNDHAYITRHKGELVGEMALIDPGGSRNASLIAASDKTYLACLSITQFHRLASENPDYWRCIANELANRMRQRDAMFLPPNEKPVIFVASSGEGGRTYFSEIESGLASDEWSLDLWTGTSIFKPSISTLNNLENRANESDFAIALVTADDIRKSRGNVNKIARDNVIFEAGLFMGALETDRVFLLVEKDADLALPSDFNGISMLFFSDIRQLHEKLGQIADCVRRKGLMYRYCRPVG